MKKNLKKNLYLQTLQELSFLIENAQRFKWRINKKSNERFYLQNGTNYTMLHEINLTREEK